MWTPVSAAQTFVYMQTLKWDTETEKTDGTVADLRPHRLLLCKVLRKTEPMTTREKNHLGRTGMSEPQGSEGSYKVARAERTLDVTSQQRYLLVTGEGGRGLVKTQSPKSK